MGVSFLMQTQHVIFQNVYNMNNCLMQLSKFQFHQGKEDREKLGVCGSKRVRGQV